MKVLRVSDEDYAAIASMIAISYPDMFQRIFIAVKQKRARKNESPAADANNMQYFMAAWTGWPTEAKGKWCPGIGYERKVVIKGSRKEAMDNFFSIVTTGVATARELYVASVAYALEAPSVKEGYVQNVSTFYGPQKATYLEWLDRARQMIQEQDSNGG